MPVFDGDFVEVKLGDFSVSDIDDIVFDIDAIDISFEIESETLLLSDREKIGAIVSSNGFAIKGFDFSFFDREFLHEKLFDWNISDEA